MLHAFLVSTLLCFVYTLRCFYIFSGTNLLTSCHGASCLFSSVFGSRKAKNQYYRNWTGQKPMSIFYRGRHEVQRRHREEDQGGQTPLGAGGPTPRLGRVWGPWPPPSLASLPIRSPGWRNP